MIAKAQLSASLEFLFINVLQMATKHTFSIYDANTISSYVSMQMWIGNSGIRNRKARKRISFLEGRKILKKQRVCLLLNFEVYTKMRNLQAEKIKRTNRSVSFSQLVEDLVKNGMKN